MSRRHWLERPRGRWRRARLGQHHSAGGSDDGDWSPQEPLHLGLHPVASPQPGCPSPSPPPLPLLCVPRQMECWGCWGCWGRLGHWGWPEGLLSGCRGGVCRGGTPGCGGARGVRQSGVRGREGRRRGWARETRGPEKGAQWHLGSRGARQWGRQTRPGKPALARPSRAPCAPIARAPARLLASELPASMLLRDTQGFFFPLALFSQ